MFLLQYQLTFIKALDISTIPSDYNKLYTIIYVQRVFLSTYWKLCKPFGTSQKTTIFFESRLRTIRKVIYFENLHYSILKLYKNFTLRINILTRIVRGVEIPV